MILKRIVYATASSLALSATGAALAQVETDADADSQQFDAPETDVIVVEGIRQSIEQGLEFKRGSTQIVDSIVAEDIGKFPDNNVIEALQRVTGVQVTNRQAGEASAITIRGLPDATTTWNGRNVFTAGGTALALQDIPSTLVNRIDVYKTRSAEQIPAGLAGLINISTRRPLDTDGFDLNLQGRAFYNEQGDSWTPAGSILIKDTWDTDAGRFGASVNLSYQSTEYRDQLTFAGAMVPFAPPNDPPAGFTPLQRYFDGWPVGLPTGLSYEEGATLPDGRPYVLSRDAMINTDGYGDRERPAASAALQWQPNEDTTYTLEYLYQGFRNELFNNLHFAFVDFWGALGPNPAATAEFYDGTNIISERFVGAPAGFQSGDITKSSTDTHAVGFNADWTVLDGRMNIVSDLSYQDSKFDTQFFAQRLVPVQNPDALFIDFNADDGLPAYTFLDIPEGGSILGGVPDNSHLTDPNSWLVGALFDNKAANTGDGLTFMTDVDYDLGWDGDRPWKQISFGVRWDRRGATASEVGQPQEFPDLGVVLSELDPDLQYYNENFFDGRASIPESWVVNNGYYLLDNRDAVRQLYADRFPDLNVLFEDDLDLFETFDVEETTMELYAQIDAEHELFGRPLSSQFGVRLVDLNTEIEFRDYGEFLNTGQAPVTSVEKDDREILPFALLTYNATDDLLFRFNYGESIRRPAFGDLNPNIGLTGDLSDLGYGSGAGGNPDLEATKATNIDFSAEWYFGDNDAIYATLFRREVEGLVVTIRNPQIINDSRFPDTSLFIVTQPVNASDGTLEGAEVGFTWFPDALPGPLDGLGFLGSATILSSNQTIPIPNDRGEIVDERENDFFGVSDLSFNTTLAYERGPIGARLSYVWREEFLLENEAALFANPLGIWRRPEKSLDLSTSLDIGEHIELTFDAINLTDELTQDYYRFEDFGTPELHNFRNYLIGRRFIFGARYEY
ncbi:TonB-dependent receptor [Parvularcula oceani]|uniref:TonB-dependent receptor n=1 Tax=Parvularcula oceani TaxID=1247963 RepID=UPI0004E10031|nr:TonB-dependent receptor [Parvularcula oceani]